MRHSALVSNPSDVLIEDVVYISLPILLVLRYVVTAVYAFYIWFDKRECDSFLCLDTCGVFVVYL